jgi:3-dehydroquinate synthase
MTIRHHRGSYEIRRLNLEELQQQIAAELWVISDENVVAAYGGAKAGLVLRAGEETKSFSSYQHLVEQLATLSVRRSHRLVAFGGGVIGDLVGFAAATYLRGIPFVQVPTTLLAMVDSSVGGKVGVDLPLGKNLVGAFHPPSEVWLCHELLSTLPERQVRNGMAEVWKYAYIMDVDLVDQLDAAIPTEASMLEEALVDRCIAHKRDVVQADEFETNGYRAILNFGHTIGHAIEQVLGYRELLHGEAIAIGMVAEACLGELLGFTEAGTAATMQDQLQRQGLPTTWAGFRNPDPLLQAMFRDKKVVGNALAFSLVPKIGACKLVTDVPVAAVREVISQ